MSSPQVFTSTTRRLCVVVFSLTCVGADVALAQADAESQSELTVIELRFVKAEEAAVVISNLFDAKESRVRVVPVPRNNQLIVRASKAEQRQITAILEKIDVADSANADGRAITKVYPVKNLSLNENFANTLKALWQEKNAAFTLSARGNAVVVRGDDATHRMVADLIRTLDALGVGRSVENLQVRIVWLMELKNAKEIIPLKE